MKWGEQGSMGTNAYLSMMDVLEEQLLAEVLELPYICIRRLLDVAAGEEVEPDMSFLNLFFRNLMMGENHELKNGFVAPLYPNNPKHPRQKYLLTVKGLAIFNSTK